MLKGKVASNLEARVDIIFRIPDGTFATVEAVIDTGFTSELVAPEYVLEQIGLPLARPAEFRLADHTIIEVQSYQVKLVWHGEERDMIAFATGEETLIGMRLLHGSRVIVDVVPDGSVEIAELN